MTVTQNYDNIIPSTPILSADPNVKEDVMRDQQKITISGKAPFTVPGMPIADKSK